MNENMKYFNSPPVPKVRITSRYGKRNTGIAGASTFHRGIDLGGSGSGVTPILAVRRGIIEKNYWNDVRGWVLVIKHSDRYSTLYQHLASRSPLQPGEYVPAGKQIGIMGNSSKKLKIAPHLHMELHENGTPIDFERWLSDIRGIEADMTEKELREIIQQELKATLRGADAEPSSWAADAWAKAEADGITDGSRPGGYVTREQVVTMIERAKR